MDTAFWKGKKVLVTGATGFKGSWLCTWLLQMGARVTGYSLPPETESLFTQARMDTRFPVMYGDIRDLAQVQDAVVTVRPDIVFHLAAQAIVRPSYQHPVETYATNVMGTVHLLEAVRLQPGIKAVINVTSDKCYENREWHWGYREDEPMGGYDPYSSSKGCAELVTAAYRQSFFNPSAYPAHGVAIATARAGNVIGSGDWADDRLIPDIIRAFSTCRPVCIRNPGAIRPWQHVLDALAGYLLLAEHLYRDGPDYGEGWNFGAPDEDARPVGWIVAEMQRLWGEPAEVVFDTVQQPHEAHFLKLDCAKARHRLHWRPLLKLNEALAWTVEGYRALATAQPLDVLHQQIGEYMHRMQG